MELYNHGSNLIECALKVKRCNSGTVSLYGFISNIAEDKKTVVYTASPALEFRDDGLYYNNRKILTA